MDLKKKIGKRIQELRYKNGLKQSELAEMVGIATKTQSCIETGKNFPSADLLERYAKAFKVDISELLKLPHLKDEKVLLEETVLMLQRASHEQLKLLHQIISAVIN